MMRTLPISPLSGFKRIPPMVFSSIYPSDSSKYEDLKVALEKLQLNDASLTFQPESSVALGFGFRCGFLGLLHMEIVQERLEREFNMDVITTVPNVSYRVYDKKGNMKEVHNRPDFPIPHLSSASKSRLSGHQLLPTQPI